MAKTKVEEESHRVNSGILDLVEDGHNGLLVSPGGVDELSLAIENLLVDDKMRTAMGRRGRVMAQNYSIEEMVKKTEALYVSVCKQA